MAGEDSTRPAAPVPDGAGKPSVGGGTGLASGFFLLVGWVAVLLWIRTGSPWSLAAGSACVCAVAFARASVHRRVSAVLLAAAVTAGFFSIAGERRFSSGWEAYRGQREAQVTDVVGAEMDSLTVRGDAAARRAAAAATAAPSLGALQDSLRALLAGAGATAVAVFGEDERLRTWAGSHHGKLPNEVLDGRTRHFGGSTLFSYMYFAAPVAGGGAAVVASLMRSDLPEPFSAGLGDFASRMRERTGERIEVSARDSPGEEGGAAGAAETTTWRVVLRDQADQRATHVRFWKRVAAAVAALAWTVQLVGAPRRARYRLLLLLAAAVLLPLEEFFFAPYLTDLAAFRLPGPLPLTLGRVLVLSCALVPVVARAAPLWRGAAGSWVAPLVVAAGFPLGLTWFSAGASMDLLGTAGTTWVVFQAAVTLSLAVVAAAALGTAGGPPAEAPRRRGRQREASRLGSRGAGCGCALPGDRVRRPHRLRSTAGPRGRLGAAHASGRPWARRAPAELVRQVVLRGRAGGNRGASLRLVDAHRGAEVGGGTAHESLGRRGRSRDRQGTEPRRRASRVPRPIERGRPRYPLSGVDGQRPGRTGRSRPPYPLVSRGRSRAGAEAGTHREPPCMGRRARSGAPSLRPPPLPSASLDPRQSLGVRSPDGRPSLHGHSASPPDDPRAVGLGTPSSLPWRAERIPTS